MLQASSKPLIVGAIDLGTTYSRSAFSFLRDFNDDPTKGTVKWWNSNNLLTDKTPTCVLIGPDKTFLAFGYEAENMYKDLIDEGKHKRHYYFRRFTMMFYKEGLRHNTTLEDEMGKSLPALLVFSMSLRYLIQVTISDIINRDMGVGDVDILWVLTVPAIWSDTAKRFMREAANEAGVCNDRLLIALDPEATSLYCHHVLKQYTVYKSHLSNSKFIAAGTKFMIIDARDRTTDITGHEVTSGGQLKEIASASGGEWGNSLVDKAFEDLITDIFRRDVYEKFKETETEDWLELWRVFDLKKISVTPKSKEIITMRLPTSLVKTYEECTGETLKEVNANNPHREKVKVAVDKMRFEAEFFKNLFDEYILKTVDHVRSILTNVQVKVILMVGGFPGSPMLQNAIKSEFACEGIDVVVPEGYSSTIVLGALIFGHSPIRIREPFCTPTRFSEK